MLSFAFYCALLAHWVDYLERLEVKIVKLTKHREHFILLMTSADLPFSWPDLENVKSTFIMFLRNCAIEKHNVFEKLTNVACCASLRGPGASLKDEGAT